MKIFKYLSFLLIGCLFAVACVEDEAPEDAFGAGQNLVTFSNASQNLSGVADGSEYTFQVPLDVRGPRMQSVTGPVTATITVNPNSTAIEGTHYRIDNKTVQFSTENDLLSALEVTLLTDGIEAPLDEAPVLILNVSTVTGENVIANSKTIRLNLLYLCPSYLAGTYDVTVEWLQGGESRDPITFVDVVTETGVGEYRTGRVGHWTPAALGGTPGFTFIDVCDALTVPEQNLVDLYSNIVNGKPGLSYVNPETGTLHFEFTICATSCNEYVVEYVKQ